MFTGIIQDCGRVGQVSRVQSGRRLVLQTRLGRELRLGDSLAVNGVCLTAEGVEAEQVVATIVDETLARSTLGALRPGERVNLEPALRAGEPFGGHIVQGHVDGCCRVRHNGQTSHGWSLELEVEAALLRYVVEKGSITIDGVSLTVAQLQADRLAVALVPHTLEQTVLRDRRPGQQVNVEVDILAKYVERLFAGRANEPSSGRESEGLLDEARLRALGYR